jgi:RHS repeat-associated protein
MDKSVTTQQDSLTGFTADLTQAQINAFFADPQGPLAAALLGNATSRIVYDFGRFARLPSTPQALAAAFAATIARETHVQDLPAGQTARLQVSVSYSDGFGREIQRKLQADPGPLAPGGPVVQSRWIGSGWTIWNNKGKPVRKYEPFFADSSDFSFGTAVGVSSTLSYDPAERVVVTLHPDHSWEKVVFDPWRQDNWDANDTVLIPDPSADADVGAFFRRLPQADYLPTWFAQRNGGKLGAEAQDAAQKAAVHANTPSTVHFDTLGRAFLTFAFNRFQSGTAPPVEGHYRTFVTFDIEGNQLEITDALGRVIMTYDYDMQSTRLRQYSADAGERWILNDATGNPFLRWDSRDHRIERQYDAARRPVGLWVQTWVARGSQNSVFAERTIYGEGQPNDQALNLRGKPFQQYDAAGVVTNTAFDFTGNLLSSSRELLTNYKGPVDWSLSPAPELTGEAFSASSTFDALNRPVTLVSPDGSIVRPVYDDTGRLDQVWANLRGATTPTAFVTNIDYNAKGQRSLIEYGNGAETNYRYDPETFRLIELKTRRASDNAVLQDLTYSYDPVGNITWIGDAAQQTIYFNNQVVTANANCTYDALYRLISAAGREHIGQLTQPQIDWDDTPRMNQPLPTDGQAMRNYVENYSYDAVGNILQIVHQAASNGSWTRIYAYDEPSGAPTNNRLTSTTVGALKEPYTYDARGNMTSMPHLPQMTWDFKEQLASTQRQVVNNSPAEATCYVYNATGQRVRKVTQSGSGTKTKERIYLGSYEVYREYGSDGRRVTLERQTLHVMDDKRRVAMAETNTTSGAATILRYQFDNHLGSASLELDGNAAVISYEEYYPYGSTSFQAVSGAIQVSLKRYRYTGKERDEETGFYYHGARYYAPWLGRWTSCDRTGIKDGPNVYAYVNARPINLSDPNGRWGVSDLVDRAESYGKKVLDAAVPTPVQEFATGAIKQEYETAKGMLQEGVDRLQRAVDEIKADPVSAVVDASIGGPSGALAQASLKAEVKHTGAKLAKVYESERRAGSGVVFSGTKAANDVFNPATGLVDAAPKVVDAVRRGKLEEAGRQAERGLLSLGSTIAVAAVAVGAVGKIGGAGVPEPLEISEVEVTEKTEGLPAGGGEDTVTLEHGTTLKRAKSIVEKGPDPSYVEPGDQPPPPDAEFSTTRGGATAVGGSARYARKKASIFPDEGGPAIVEMKVPKAIVDKANSFGGYPGFSPGWGLEELKEAWSTIEKRIIKVGGGTK